MANRLKTHMAPALAATVILLLTSPALAQGKKPGGGGGSTGPSSYSLTIAFTDSYDPLTGERVERIGSDGLGPYVHGQLRVRAEMSATVTDPSLNQLNFDSGDRHTYFNFDQPYLCPSSGCLSPFGSHTSGSSADTNSIIGGCTDSPLHAMALDQNQRCYWKLVGPRTDYTWHTRFNPGEDGREEPTLVTITCNRTSSSDGKCDRWRVRGGDTDVAASFRLDGKGKNVKSWRGSYFMPFEFTMER